MNFPFKARVENGRKIIAYRGNCCFASIQDVQKVEFPSFGFPDRVRELPKDRHLSALHTVDRTIFRATVDYFSSIGADWCNLPITTRMISSPGEVYAGRTLDYTTDTIPISLSWFDLDRNIFLSESSQFYLELRLLIPGVDKVFSIYNSFRKEPADFCRLAEFQHIEYEAAAGFGQNVDTAKALLKAITRAVVSDCPEALRIYMTDEELDDLGNAFDNDRFEQMTLREGLNILYEATADNAYREHSLKNFGSWEEVRLTELVGKHVILCEYPVMEIPFYHAEKHSVAGSRLANNADFLLTGYRETIGSGVRIKEKDALLAKAKAFNLPEGDYAPYLAIRSFPSYRETAGFGLGWQRYVQWLLKLPFIWLACHVPRGHGEPVP
jgi:asparaginyl-tRNA synthetase